MSISLAMAQRSGNRFQVSSFRFQVRIRRKNPMPTFQSFEEIEAWQKARELTREVYAVSDEGPFARDFGLRDQMRRASVSILSNIAEGFERSGTGEFVQFLSAAKGSAGEVRAQLYVALDQGYIEAEKFRELSAL